MSCGRTPTRRIVHAKKRHAVAAKHGKVHKLVHQPPPGAKRKVKVRKLVHQKPAPKHKAKTAKLVHQKLSAKQAKSLKAWEKAHPFKSDHAAWIKAHPFKHNKNRQHQLKHKIVCHVKTRHAVSSSRNKKKPAVYKPSGRIMKAVHPQKAARAQRAQTAWRAR